MFTTTELAAQFPAAIVTLEPGRYVVRAYLDFYDAPLHPGDLAGLYEVAAASRVTVEQTQWRLRGGQLWGVAVTLAWAQREDV